MLIFLTYFQIIVSILLMIAILLQRRGGGLSPVLGGSGGFYRSRRGVERVLFTGTIVLAVLFLAGAAMNIIVR
ncbi:MAG: preprotein translocase subunit SecG [Candidatus Sungbacteria bacterium RIFCSPLOWO2_02_FULL_54_10]|uniref:Protein-export membrane protein SecG n=2 Tax=Candidatus Sungiibacteriota TaxID=1817917 RepID=A0A1G2L718_9BACT|nr:MAG: preprotein translocase subunit SecG [Candidatus Sungbacteria bacterium RIFCSPHIGHO2_01_FULL_54_26]OHA02842.1 MAG: preprotein translocase subunit SecG [Candidatus Sungbacteria bacterium RIFCSPHIGHO2_02_FULL_53_17]OHA06612.1 MAG: preprotein translocase subunit SecG [Candidatus Sungbacteria bacterium RIFCSPLOWO2_01_FULL_54_21]OHA12444.1 MAG: preprotein translocase subunit SecG [Candidatus Sungbacteria bacterium RIFCSPLOWO2_02_FULL_54_10]